ncbi:MAG: L-threonylcarbamoyladenylate synthase [Bacteroidales bacterium]|jgi:L-threonylcarbamoyladenylate synthase|nr:L-threonylcarbamoyladenylate synthase [Bacteroidales bacterium]
MIKANEFADDLKKAVDVLIKGGVILYPTDTIWGLGCDATRQDAVERIFSIKQRDDSKSLIVLVNGFGMLERYVRNVPEIAYQLAEVADKPLTIIYPNGRNLAPGVSGSDGSVGIRICAEGFCNELITRFRKPIISTSANISNAPAPAIFSEIEEVIASSADYVVSYRQSDTTRNTPSSIIKVEDDGVIRIIRK